MPFYDAGASFTFSESDLWVGSHYINPTAAITITLPDAGEDTDLPIFNVGATHSITFNKPDASALAVLKPGDSFTIRTYSDSSSIPQYEVVNEAYGATWNGNLEFPTKDAVYDKIEAVIAAGGTIVIYEETVTDVDSPYQGLDFTDTATVNLTVSNPASPSNVKAIITAERAALTGDVTAGLNSNATTIANDAVTFAKMQNATQACFLGATGAGDFSERTYANTRSDLGLVIGTNVQAFDAQLTSLAALDYTGNTLKVIRVNAGETDFELATISGGSGLTHPQVLARTMGA